MYIERNNILNGLKHCKNKNVKIYYFELFENNHEKCLLSVFSKQVIFDEIPNAYNNEKDYTPHLKRLKNSDQEKNLVKHLLSKKNMQININIVKNLSYIIEHDSNTKYSSLLLHSFTLKMFNNRYFFATPTQMMKDVLEKKGVILKTHIIGNYIKIMYGEEDCPIRWNDSFIEINNKNLWKQVNIDTNEELNTEEYTDETEFYKKFNIANS